MMQRDNAAGLPQGGESFVAQSGMYRAAVAMNSEGDYAVVWCDAASGGYPYIRRFNRFGQPVDAPFPVNSVRVSNQEATSVALRDNGDLVVAYVGCEQPWPSGGYYDIYCQRLTGRLNDGGGIYSAAGGTVNVKNTLIAGNSAVHESPDIAGAIVSQGHNLLGDAGNATGLQTNQVVPTAEFLVNVPRILPWTPGRR